MLTVALLCLYGLLASCKYFDNNDENKDDEQEKKPETVTMYYHSADGNEKGGYWLEGGKKVTLKKVSATSGRRGLWYKPSVPQSDDADFIGWYEQIGSGLASSPYVFFEPLTEDVVLYAKWKSYEESGETDPTEKTKVKLSFEASITKESGETISVAKDPVWVDTGSKVDEPSAPGYETSRVFTGWFTSTDYNERFDFANRTIDADTTVYGYYADWKGTLAELIAIQGTLASGASLYITGDGQVDFSNASVKSWFKDKTGMSDKSKDAALKVNFSGLTSLTSIDAETFKDIESFAAIIFPYSVEEIGKNAFKNGKLSGMILPPKLKKIGKEAFMDNDELGYFVIPEGVEEIDENAFAGIKDLRPNALPSTLKTLHPFVFWESIFGDCKIYYNGTMEQFNAITFLDSDKAKDPFTIVCTDGEMKSKVYLRKK